MAIPGLVNIDLDSLQQESTTESGTEVSLTTREEVVVTRAEVFLELGAAPTSSSYTMKRVLYSQQWS